MRSTGLIARVLLLTVLSSPVAAATPGIFEGMVDETDKPKVPAGWILVQSKNGMLRKVEISRAHVTYATSVPSSERVEEPSVALVHGTEVRVTAEQDSSGEWRAAKIEILRLPSAKSRATDWIAGSRDELALIRPQNRCFYPSPVLNSRVPG